MATMPAPIADIPAQTPRTGEREAVALLRNAQTVVMACHIKPDGDALGSMLALARGLQGAGRAVTMLCDDPAPESLRFLPGIEAVRSHMNSDAHDLGILLDAGDIERAGRAGETVGAARQTLCIDHHATESFFGRTRFVDSNAAATAELIYDLLHHLQIPIDTEIAECLMTGLLTDTGQFRFPATTPRTFRIGAELRAAGANPDAIVSEVYESRTLASQRLLGTCLSKIVSQEDGRILYTSVTRADLANVGAEDADTEGILNNIRIVRGAEIAFLLHELANGDIRVSLRGRMGRDVGQIAQRHGGGGHKLAAGCVLALPLNAVEREILASSREMLVS